MSNSAPNKHLTEEADREPQTQQVLQRADQAMRLVCANLPWLSGLAYAVEILPDERVAVAAVSRSGRVMINPQVFLAISIAEATYILAHELLHLALDTFSREEDTADHDSVNRAHDYIINDILRHELQMSPPLGGLDLSGASDWSLEKLVRWMNENKGETPVACWTWSPSAGSGHSGGSSGGTLSSALRDAGLLPKPGKRPSQPEVARSWHLQNLDVLPEDLERELFPDNELQTPLRSERIRREAAKSLALREVSREVNRQAGRGTMPGDAECMLNALRGNYVTPWEVALQRWMESTAPGPRTYSRPSRRGADRTDCVLPGRLKEGWTLHLVLDTSGSMEDELSSILGAIAMFCENTGVADVHILQCDVEVTVDEWIPVEELENYRIAGYGGSDMSPAIQRLAEYPEVTALIILTDGYIDYPPQEPGCNVLWVLTEQADFHPPYGEVLTLR